MAWNVSLAFLLMALTLVAYVAAIVMEQTQSVGRRRAILCCGTTVILLPLLGFKYTNFLISTLNDFSLVTRTPLSIPIVNLITPVGISFHTFQMIGYLVDVAGERVPAERHLGRFAGFVVFFPQLVAGPIERSVHMLPQFWRPTRIQYERFRDGVLQMTWGLFKKVCIADLVAPFVASVYADPRSFNGSYLLMATLLFTIQIYCDFSGYSDMALGIARSSAMTSWSIFDNRTSRPAWPNSGGAGTSRSRPGFAITSTSPWVGAGSAAPVGCSTSWSFYPQRRVARRGLDVHRLGALHGCWLLIEEGCRSIFARYDPQARRQLPEVSPAAGRGPGTHRLAVHEHHRRR